MEFIIYGLTNTLIHMFNGFKVQVHPSHSWNIQEQILKIQQPVTLKN